MLQISLLDQESYHNPNWAVHLSKEHREAVAQHVLEAVKVDEESRREWLEQNQVWVELSQQILNEKSYPWPQAAAIKFPMLTTAALQFHARAHQELLKDERIVFAKVLGRDEGGEKAARGRRVEDAMSMQFMFHMLEWQDDMDRMLYVLPLIGTVFKKTYWSDMKGRPVSELVLPSEMVVAYHAQDWLRARKTHKLYLTHNEVVEQQRIMAYLDVDIGTEGERDSTTEQPGMIDDEFNQVQIDGDQPHEILECHCWYDLDDDGYEEPYIVTVDRATEQLLRIVPRFRRSDVRDRPDGIIMAIDSIEYVTPFKFFPSVDSKVYGTGFGQLLGPLNRAVNSVINQLLDAGTLSNMQSGFLGRGVRVTKGGRVRFRPGEWLELSSTGDDLRKGVFPLPVKEPSNVLFQLLGYLVQAGKEVSSVAEIMTGQNPGQNQPFSTTQTVLGEGMQVFLGIYKRIYRALAQEYRRVYDLNFMYLSDAIYSELLDEPAGADVVQDFDPKGLDILPQADPNMANSVRKQQRVQSLMQAQQAGMNLNQEYVIKQFLESIDEPNIEEVMKVQPPPPTEAELEDKRFYAKLELDAKDLELRAEMNQNQPIRDEAAALANVAKARHLKADIEIKRQESGADITLKEMDADMKAMDADNALANRMMDNADKLRDHQMKQAEGTMKLAQEGIKLEAAQAKANEPNTTQ